VDNAKAARDTAKNNLAVTQSSLEQVLVENQKSITAAEADVSLKKAAVERAKAAYNLTIATPRNVDVASLKAQVSQAESAYGLTLQNIKDAQIVAPVNGVVTDVNGEVGENTSGSEIIVKMITPQLKVVANVSETDIAKVKTGDLVTMTLDAFPPDVILKGKISSIDPAETVVQGVIYYQIKTLFDINNADIKSGMTANLDILAAEEKDVITMTPQAVQYKDGKPLVKVLINNKSEDRAVTLGLQGNDKIEVLSGVAVGDTLVLLEKPGK
jgi:HlyD family secretion protein